MKCNKCGTYVLNTEKFCPNCGSIVNNINEKLKNDEMLEFDKPIVNSVINIISIVDVILGSFVPLIFIIQYFTSNFYFFTLNLGKAESDWINISLIYAMVFGVISTFMILFCSLSKYNKYNKIKMLSIVFGISLAICFILLSLGMFASAESIIKGCE